MPPQHTQDRPQRSRRFFANRAAALWAAMSCTFSALGVPARHVLARAAPGDSKRYRFSLRQRAKSEQEQILLQSHRLGKVVARARLRIARRRVPKSLGNTMVWRQGKRFWLKKSFFAFRGALKNTQKLAW